MRSKLVPSLVIISALCGSYAAPDDGVSSALSRVGWEDGKVLSAVVLGTDSSGHTSYSIEFAQPILTGASVATAPDTTITAAATLVEGSTDAHLVEVLTVGTETVTYSENCALNNGSAVCTRVGKNQATTVSTVVTVTPCAFPCVSNITSFSPTPKNGGGRMGVARASVLAVVVAGVLLA